jgi:hypothetical protein
MRTPRTLAGVLLLLVVVLAGTACEAPLEPKSKQAADAATAVPTASATASPTEAAASPTPSATPTRAPRATPSITVPKLPKTPALPRYRGIVLGNDVSWPQCPEGMGIPQKRTLGLPMPVPEAKFVIIGLTNGPAFTPNPCLASQVQWVKERKLLAGAYAVSSYPDDRTLAEYGPKGPFDGGTRLGALANVGYQQAKYNVANLRRAGLTTPVIWIDVEPVPIFEWSPDTTANAAVVRGAARGYTDSGYRIGAYSTQALWETVVGDLRLGLPEWRAAGQTSRAEALRRCGPDRMYQGGDAVLSQWVEASRDFNVTCPGTAREIHRWFHQY